MRISNKWLATGTAVIALALVAAALDLHLKCNPQQVGMVSLRGHYRGWFLSFSDGLVWDGRSQRLRWGTVLADGTTRVGLRWLPRAYHLSMPTWHEDKFVSTGAPTTASFR